MNKIKIIFISLISSCALGLTSCSDVQIQEAVKSESVQNLSYSVDGRNVTLNWTNPSSSDQSGIEIIKDNTDVTDVDGVVNTYYIKRAPVNTDVAYTVKARYSDGRISEGQTARLNIQYTAQAKPGMLIAYNSVSEIEDDDEKAAVEWFPRAYPTGVIFTPNNISEIYPDEVSALWIMIDRVGISQGWKNLPSAISSDATISALTQYAKDGGNLLLCKHATQLVSAIGRISDNYAPGIFGSGDGGSGTDNWGFNAVIGSGLEESYDHRGHSAFTGMEELAESDYGHPVYAMEGPGWREDHNCMWDLNAYGLTTANGANVVLAFQNVTNSTVLGTWAHVLDYCCAGIVEFNATSDYPGKIIAIGLSAYEFNQNTGNKYQSNIELMTKNSIDYLMK